jgi:hypothetical protein
VNSLTHYPVDEGGTFLRNVAKKLPIHTHNKPEEDLRSHYEKSFTTNEALQHFAISIV